MQNNNLLFCVYNWNRGIYTVRTEHIYWIHRLILLLVCYLHDELLKQKARRNVEDIFCLLDTHTYVRSAVYSSRMYDHFESFSLFLLFIGSIFICTSICLMYLIDKKHTPWIRKCWNLRKRIGIKRWESDKKRNGCLTRPKWLQWLYVLLIEKLIYKN